MLSGLHCRDSLHVLLSCWRVSPQCGWRRSHNATCIHAVYTRSIEPHVGSVVRVVKCVSQLHIKQIDFDPFNNHFECQVELTQTLCDINMRGLKNALKNRRENFFLTLKQASLTRNIKGLLIIGY